MEPLISSSIRRMALRVLLGALLWGTSARAETGTAPPSTLGSLPEYQVKAAYLLKFARYVEWPAGTFPAPDTPLVIGVLGGNPFGDQLERTVASLRSQGRPLVVRYPKDAVEASRCQVVYITGNDTTAISAWLTALKPYPILTITDSEKGLELGAVLSLLLEETTRGTKVRFQASLPAVHAAQLQISAEMLRSAKSVIRSPEETTPKQ